MLSEYATPYLGSSMYHMRMVKRGFTILELLVVVAIIGIIAALSLASLNVARVKGRDSSRLAAVKQIQNALEVYYNENNVYPPVPAGFPDDLVQILTPYLVPKYIAAIKYDTTNTAPPTYYSPANNTATYLIYVPTEMQWGTAYGCRTGVGPVVTAGYYSFAPVCH